MFDLQNLAVNLGGRSVLRGLTATIPSSKLVALIGPNGSGKSTLLRTLAGIIKPNQGAYHRSTAGEIAYMPQSNEPHPFSVRETVAMGRYRHTFRFVKLNRESIDAIDDGIARCDLNELQKRRFDNLSQGERQRVVVARTLCQNAAVLLFDEPLANMDLKYQLLVIAELKKEAMKHKTVVVALHDLTLAQRYADHVVVLSNGRLFKSGPPEDVFAPSLLTDVFGVNDPVFTAQFDARSKSCV